MLYLAPQFLQPDSSRNNTDKLPFAPFVNKERQIEKANADEQNKKAKPAKLKSGSLSMSPLERDTSNNSTQVFYNSSLQFNDSLQISFNDSTPNAPTITNTFRFSDDDGLVQAYDEKTLLPSLAYFEHHSLQPTGFSPMLISQKVPDWFTFILFLIITGLTVIKVFYNRIFIQLFNAFYSLAVTNQVVRDENILVQRASILLNIIFYGGAGLFLYYTSMYFSWTNRIFNEGILRFFFFAFVTAVFFSVKMLTLKILSNVFHMEKPVSIYIFSIFLTNNMLGLVLIPLLACMVYMQTMYTEYIIYSCLGFILLAFAYLLYRAVVISSTMPRLSLYYLFLYFCTLEIAPLLLIIKMATG